MPEEQPYVSAGPQRILSAGQVAAFYHDQFVETQVRHFRSLVGSLASMPRTVVDVGGGCGYFAEALQAETGVRAQVLDNDSMSVAECRRRGVDATLGDALAPVISGDEDVVCFNLVLHHLVGPSEGTTLQLQRQALAAWHGRATAVFVDEYIYDSWFGDLSGRMIYAITSSRSLSALASAISRVVPSLRANTFGVGVRFRCRRGWVQLFESIGFHVAASARGSEEHVSLARRLLFIRSCRRDSFLLQPVRST